MKKVLLAVSGGIAVYKACDIVSKLTKRNVDVQVIMTENATKFVTPLTFEALSKHMVFTDTFDYTYDASIKHISLAQEADLFCGLPLRRTSWRRWLTASPTIWCLRRFSRRRALCWYVPP